MGISFSGGVIPVGTFKIKANIPPVWVTLSGSLGDANGGQPYTFNLSATDPENAPLAYTVVGGSLPAGLSLNSVGVISGTPVNIPGNYPFTIRVSDGESHVDRAFNLYVTNQTPIWSTAGGALAIGTQSIAYTTTFIATDPNGDAVTYSVVDGSLPSGLVLNTSTGVLFGTPTVVANNSFTIRATDAIGAYVDRAFTLTVASANDPYWTGVSLLMHMDGTNGSTTFTDQRGHIFTNNGGTTLTTALQKFGTASALFNGTTTYLSTPSTSEFNFADGDFTIEAWVNPSSYSVGTGSGGNHLRGIVTKYDATASNNKEFLFCLNNGAPSFGIYTTAGIPYSAVDTNVLPLNTWTHLAVTRNSNTLRLFVNGVETANTTLPAGTAIKTSNQPVGLGVIHTDSPDSYPKFAGALDEVRITKGVARYTGNFTPSPVAFPHVGVADQYWSNTKMLLHFNSNFTDATGRHTITASGVTAQSSTATFSANGYLSTPYHADWNFGSDNFTVEGWVYITSLDAVSQMAVLFGQYENNAQPINGWVVYFETTGAISAWVGITGKALTVDDFYYVTTGGSTVNINAWNHVAFVRNGTELALYLNGMKKAATTMPVGFTAHTSTLPLTIGAYNTTGYHRFQQTAHMDEIRITKGVARYTTDFTPVYIEMQQGYYGV